MIYLDGKYLKVSARILEAFTPGAFKAKGVFETMLGMGGCVMDGALHLQRLRRGLSQLGIKIPHLPPTLLQQVLRNNGLALARVRLMVWQEGGQAHVMAAALPYKPINKIYRVCLLKTDRAATDRWAEVKSLDYALFAEAFDRARAQGFDEALLLNRRGHIFEASRANIFWVKDKVLYTPPLASGCLNGITRQQVIRQARRLKTAVVEKFLTPAALKAADAAFLTNSLLGIKPLETPSLTQF